eukprot:2553460-Rhodomonas_salina.1
MRPAMAPHEAPRRTPRGPYAMSVPWSASERVRADLSHTLAQYRVLSRIIPCVSAACRVGAYDSSVLHMA